MKSMLTPGFFTTPFLHRLLCLLIILSTFTVTYSQDTLYSAITLKKLSLEELMNIEVTSVSKHPEKLPEIASVAGQFLLDDRHLEFIPSSPSEQLMMRNIYGKITCRL